MTSRELNEAIELDMGDPIELGAQYARMKGSFPELNVMGGCCGTDHRHVDAVIETCLSSVVRPDGSRVGAQRESCS